MKLLKSSGWKTLKFAEREVKANELSFVFSKEEYDWEGLFDELFRACVKRKGQDKFHKVEIRKGFHREYDVIEREEVQDKVIESYSKEVKSRELLFWKDDMRSPTGTLLDDGHLLIGDEPRKKNFQELRETKTSMPSLKSFKKEDSS